MAHGVRLVDIRPNWQVQRVLGRGGEGIVYLVIDAETNSEYVVKLFHSPGPLLA